MNESVFKESRTQSIPGPFSLTIATPSSLFSKFSKYSKVLPVADGAAGDAENLLRGCAMTEIPFLNLPLNMTTPLRQKDITSPNSESMCNITAVGTAMLLRCQIRNQQSR